MTRLKNYSLLQCLQPKEYQYFLMFLIFIQVRTDKNKSYRYEISILSIL